MPQKKNNSNNSEKPKNAYFLSLELENVRCFGEKQRIDFSDDNNKPRQWTIILGDNGTGKTTLLQTLYISIPTKKDAWACPSSISPEEGWNIDTPLYCSFQNKITFKGHDSEKFNVLKLLDSYGFIAANVLIRILPAIIN